jgi:hypothetical protein
MGIKDYFGLNYTKNRIYPLTKLGKYGIVFASRFGRSTFAERADL